MVDGVRMVFRKELMLKRLDKEGKSSMVNDEVLSIMDNLDGCEVSTASWNRWVKDAPVYSCIGKDGKAYDVNEDDCE